MRCASRCTVPLVVLAWLLGGCNCGPGSAGTWGTPKPDGGIGPADGGGGSDAGGAEDSGTPDSGKPDASAIDPNAFWANDPPPKWCGPDGGTAPALPGGTPECPDDKNRQGCPCAELGKQAACWPGLRANRNLGICHDGVTTCVSNGEFGQVWGACQGYQLPDPNATKGKAACKCFSSGQWALANLSPCFIFDSTGKVLGSVSTWIDSSGKAQCPTNPTNPPQPQPGTTFTTNTLQVDCAGHFKLCYELKAGKAATPSPTDCSLVKVCTEADYPVADQVFKMPDLPSWTSPNPQCAATFASTGGYGEMSVIGLSVRCDAVDDGSGNPYVFNRVQYCPLSCNQNPTAPECAGCGQGGGGTF
ncbi:MAG: hypothetical protein HYZ28_06670 [Myxococcales bacterium]|nr:hypothetical protein [Myxococcales bacterium]